MFAVSRKRRCMIDALERGFNYAKSEWKQMENVAIKIYSERGRFAESNETQNTVSGFRNGIIMTHDEEKRYD